jgi:hypothetical protein
LSKAANSARIYLIARLAAYASACALVDSVAVGIGVSANPILISVLVASAGRQQHARPPKDREAVLTRSAVSIVGVEGIAEGTDLLAIPRDWVKIVPLGTDLTHTVAPACRSIEQLGGVDAGKTGARVLVEQVAAGINVIAGVSQTILARPASVTHHLAVIWGFAGAVP